MAERTYQKVQPAASVVATPTTSLAIRDKTYTSAVEFGQELQGHRAHGANVLVPVTYVQSPPPNYAYMLIGVQIDKSPKEIYHDKRWSQDQYALNHDGLKRLWSAAGGTWESSDRVDDGKTPYVVQMRAMGRVKDLEGEWHSAIKHACTDYRKDSPQVAGWSELQTQEGRKKIVERCESLAQNRVIRELLLVHGSYSLAELDRPFVLARLVFRANMADPMSKRLALEHGFAGISALYPPQERVRVASVIDDNEVYSDDAGELPPPDVPTEPVPSNIQEKMADFQAIALREQEDHLFALIQRKGYDASRVGGPAGIAELTLPMRLNFLQHLLSLPDKIATP